MLEFFWRGRSHVSMFLTAGVAMLLIAGVMRRFPALPMWGICAIGALLITALEFIVGAIVNVRMGLNVWDYSGRRAQLYGQICLKNSLLWFGLTAPAAFLVKVVNAL